ncbi:MAG TPA: hypothetical protein VM689_20935 [Aliidongia sp.]|nr:hypothetical protein [Aliidongia sp.]
MQYRIKSEQEPYDRVVREDDLAQPATGTSAGDPDRSLIDQTQSSEADTAMPIRSRELYQSSNGDRWSLVWDDDASQVSVLHEPISGGRSSHLDIGEFLARSGHSPERQALLRLIGTLAETPVPRS